MVRRVFGFYLLRLLNGELRDLCSLSSYYYRFLVSSLFRRYKGKLFYDAKWSQNLKNQSYRQLGFSGCLIWSVVWYFVLCVFLWVSDYWDREKSEKGKSPLRFCASAFILPSALPAQLHIATIVLFFRLHRARSLSLSQSLLDSTSTSFYFLLIASSWFDLLARFAIRPF